MAMQEANLGASRPEGCMKAEEVNEGNEEGESSLDWTRWPTECGRWTKGGIKSDGFLAWTTV